MTIREKAFLPTARIGIQIKSLLNWNNCSWTSSDDRAQSPLSGSLEWKELSSWRRMGRQLFCRCNYRACSDNCPLWGHSTVGSHRPFMLSWQYSALQNHWVFQFKGLSGLRNARPAPSVALSNLPHCSFLTLITCLSQRQNTRGSFLSVCMDTGNDNADCLQGRGQWFANLPGRGPPHWCCCVVRRTLHVYETRLCSRETLYLTKIFDPPHLDSDPTCIARRSLDLCVIPTSTGYMSLCPHKVHKNLKQLSVSLRCFNWKKVMDVSSGCLASFLTLVFQSLNTADPAFDNRFHDDLPVLSISSEKCQFSVFAGLAPPPCKFVPFRVNSWIAAGPSYIRLVSGLIRFADVSELHFISLTLPSPNCIIYATGQKGN